MAWNIFPGSNPSQAKLEKKHDSGKNYESFKAGYISVALGIEKLTPRPVFRVRGTDYIYTKEQTYFYQGQPKKDADTICTGKLRTTSIDSLIALMKGVPDSVYKTTLGIVSGGLHEIWVGYNGRSVNFTLHNAHDSVAGKIVAILNSNIPADKERLWLFGESMGQYEKNYLERLKDSSEHQPWWDGKE
jgi:hypothetical protein